MVIEAKSQSSRPQAECHEGRETCAVGRFFPTLGGAQHAPQLIGSSSHHENSIRKLLLTDLNAGTSMAAPTAERVAALPHLRVLNLANLQTTANCIAALARSSTLQSLSLSGCPVQDLDLPSLAGLPHCQLPYAIVFLHMDW